MSEETVYAHLKFQDSDKKEDDQTFDKCGGEVPSAPSHSQRQTVLILTLLCLLLLTGLGILGGMFYTTLKTEMIKSNQLQYIIEELQRNVSIQLMHNLNSTKKIRNLSAMLQKMATQLCHELYTKEPEHKCSPCPKGSKWSKDSCYSKLDGLATWQKGEILCSARNGSLVKIKSKSELEFVKSEKLYNYWLGLPPRKDNIKYEELNENIFLSAGFERSTYNLSNSNMYCGYINRMYVYYVDCTANKNVMCEQTASNVQVESVLNDLPENSM